VAGVNRVNSDHTPALKWSQWGQNIRFSYKRTE